MFGNNVFQVQAIKRREKRKDKGLQSVKWRPSDRNNPTRFFLECAEWAEKYGVNMKELTGTVVEHLPADIRRQVEARLKGKQVQRARGSVQVGVDWF